MDGLNYMNENGVYPNDEIKNEPGAVPNSFYPRSLNEMTVSKFKESLQNI